MISPKNFQEKSDNPFYHSIFMQKAFFEMIFSVWKGDELEGVFYFLQNKIQSSYHDLTIWFTSIFFLYKTAPVLKLINYKTFEQFGFVSSFPGINKNIPYPSSILMSTVDKNIFLLWQGNSWTQPQLNNRIYGQLLLTKISILLLQSQELTIDFIYLIIENRVKALFQQLYYVIWKSLLKSTVENLNTPLSSISCLNITILPQESNFFTTSFLVFSYLMEKFSILILLFSTIERLQKYIFVLFSQIRGYYMQNLFVFSKM